MSKSGRYCNSCGHAQVCGCNDWQCDECDQLESENELLKTRVKELIIWNRDEEVSKLQTQLEEAHKIIDMVENNTLMPHPHSEPQLRLNCLSERSNEYKAKWKI